MTLEDETYLFKEELQYIPGKLRSPDCAERLSFKKVQIEPSSQEMCGSLGRQAAVLC